MKITKSRLKQIIKEELESVLNEAPWMTGGQSDEDLRRQQHWAGSTDLPTGLLDEPRTDLGSGQTASGRADEIYMVKQYAQDIADNVKSLLTDQKEYVIDPALAEMAWSVESAVDRGVTTVEAAWAKLKRISKEIERAREIQAGAYGDPRPGEAGDWPPPPPPPPAVPKVTRTKTGGTRVEEPMEIKPN